MENIYVLCKENSWADSDIFSYWINTLIKRNNIIASFKCTGISIKLDGPEQELVYKHD